MRYIFLYYKTLNLSRMNIFDSVFKLFQMFFNKKNFTTLKRNITHEYNTFFMFFTKFIIDYFFNKLYNFTKFVFSS